METTNKQPIAYVPETNIDSRVRTLEDKVNSPRARIMNFEGCLKTFATLPPVADFQAGSMILFDNGASQRLYLLVNGVWKYILLT